MKTKSFKKTIALVLALTMAIMMFGTIPNVFAEGEKVAKIGDTEYATINEAFANSNDGDTIILISDADVSQQINIQTKVNLDLNGKTLTLKGSGARKICNYGELTIKGNGTMTNELGSYGMVDNFGKLTIENGTFIDAGGGNGSSFRTNAGATDAEIIVKSGTFRGIVEQTGNAFLYCNANGQITVNSGTFESTSNRAYAFINNGGMFTVNNATVYCQHGAVSATSGSLEINNGRFEAGNYYALWVTNDGEYTDVTVNGGTFVGKTYGLNASVDDGKQDTSDVSIVINDGDFSGQTQAVKNNLKQTTHEWDLKVRGGTYSSDVSKYVDSEEGYIQYKTNHNKYKVMAKPILNIEPKAQMYRVGESAALNYEVLQPNEFFNKDMLNFEKGDANILKEIEDYYDWSMYYDSINNNSIELDGDVVTAVEPGVALVNIGTEEFEDFVVVVVYDIAPQDSTSEADKQASQMLFDALKSDENTIGITEQEAYEIFYAVITGKEVTTEVVAEPIKEAEKEDVKLIEEKVEAGQKLAGYYDISVLVKVDGEEVAKLRELGKKIKVELPVSKDLPAVAKGYKRTFSVIRVHDGVAEVIAEGIEAVDGKVPVETDKFSTYAITYTDTVATNPKTGDTITIAVAMLVVAMVGVVVIKKIRK